MLDIKYIRENPELVKAAVAKKNFDANKIDELLALDTKRRALQTEIDSLRSERNTIGQSDMTRAMVIKQNLAHAEADLRTIETQYKVLMLTIPNLPSSDTPFGKDEASNVVLRKVGEPTTFSFAPKDHYHLGKALGIIESEKAGEVAGSRFTYLKGRLVQLELALVQYAMSVLTDSTKLEQIVREAGLSVSTKPFTPVLPPVLIKPDVFEKMARIEPKEERYYIEGDDLYLIGSAEHTLGPLHMGETLQEAQLPIRYVGFSTSFRREAGSYGKDTKGILRLHQFDKVEMESFTTKEEGIAEQDFFVAIQEYLVSSLSLPYQVLICSTGDQGDPDARHLDLDTWMPGENKYRETHSADYMADYQARRLGTKVKRENGESEFVHMNDATAFAGRTLIAILENYQQEDGSVKIPDVLVPFCGFNEISI